MPKKVLPRTLSNPRAEFFFLYTAGMNLFHCGTNVLIVMVPILTNKHVFEPGMVVDAFSPGTQKTGGQIYEFQF